MNRRALLVPGALASFAFLMSLGCGGGGGGSAPTNPGGGDPTFDLRFPATSVSQSFTFTKAGTWGYFCTPHQGSGMTGTVVVDAGAPSDSALVLVGQSNALSYNPSSVSIKPGGYVRWVNASTMTNHTVTRP